MMKFQGSMQRKKMYTMKFEDAPAGSVKRFVSMSKKPVTAYNIAFKL
ncbi:hypothetical protein [Paenibacillus sp. IHBB 10380]|nr:hypothetical protein [Paenibacillus sp. IHBB 10380]